MKYQIDQSGKIENTSKLTVVAVANGVSKSIVIKGVEKRKLISAMKSLDYPKTNYVYKIFAALMFLLIRKFNKNEIIFIDREYPGHESVIKDILIWLFSKKSSSLPQINFSLIGKDSPAHHLAISVFRSESKPDLVTSANEILRLFYTPRQKLGRRSRSRRDNL
jgi:hypothetical protein